MAKYRKVDPRIWNDEKFRSLSDTAQLVFLFVMTHPHQTSLGAFRASVDGLAAEKRMDSKAFRKAFEEASGKGMIRVDEEASFIWLPNFLKYNRPESPNVVKSWSYSLDMIPECALKLLLIKQVKDFAKGLDKAFLEALPEAFAKTMPNQEQEQEHEHEQEQEHESDSSKPLVAAAEPVMVFQTVGKAENWSLIPEHVDQLREAFPDLDILAECRKARKWCIDNKPKRKTPAGMAKFLFGWMERGKTKAALGPVHLHTTRAAQGRRPSYTSEAQMASPKKIAACVGVLCEAFNRKPTSVVFKAYEIAFAGIADELLDAATNAALIGCREFMPPPGQLRELAVTGGLGYESRAERAWIEFDRAVRHHGADHSVSFDDGLINATVRLCGDWVFCCGRVGDEYGVWLRKQFLETYQRLCTGGADEHLRQPLMGNLWRQNVSFPSELLTALTRVNSGQVCIVGTKQPVLLPPSKAEPTRLIDRPATMPVLELKKAI